MSRERIKTTSTTAEHLLHVPIIINKQTNKKGEKRIVITRGEKKKPLHIKLLNGHDPQFQNAYQQHRNPNNIKNREGEL